jgi:hypothetical protein
VILTKAVWSGDGSRGRLFQSVTTKGKKHLCSAAYANSGARAGSLSAAVEKDRITVAETE